MNRNALADAVLHSIAQQWAANDDEDTFSLTALAKGEQARQQAEQERMGRVLSGTASRSQDHAAENC